MIVTLRTKAIWIKLKVIEEATIDKLDMAQINLRVDQHKVDQSRIFKLTVTQINQFNMINMVMSLIKIKIDFKITLINSRTNSSNNNKFSLLLTIITPK